MQIVDLLISKGADDLNGGLHVACAHGSIKIVDFLISKGADDLNGGLESACDTNYRFAAVINNLKEIINLLISKGADDLHSGLCSAIDNNNRDLIKFMISKGANF